MARIIWGLGLLLVGSGLWVWTAAEDDRPASTTPLGTAEEGEDVGAGLAGRKRPETPKPEPDPFASINDPRELVKPLGEYGTTKAAAARLRVLLGSDAERLRAFLRLLHPDAGLGTLAHYYVKRAVTELMLAAGDVALDVLLAELDDANATWRTQIDALIGSFGRRAQRAVPRLLRQLEEVPEDPPSAEAASIVYALGAIGPAAKRVLPDIHRWLAEGATEHVEIASATALLQIGGPTKETFQHCEDLLREVNWPKQRGALLAQLGALGEDARPMIPYLLKLVAEGLLVEYSALHTLGQMGVPDDCVLAYLSKRFREGEGYERILGSYGGTLARLGEKGRDLLYRLAAERGPMALAHLPMAFQSVSPSAPRMLAAMEPAFISKETAIRRAAFGNLSHLFEVPPAALLQTGLRGLQDENDEIREICAWLVANVKPLPADAAKALLARVLDPDETLDTALGCAGALAEQKRWRSERLFSALLALQRKHPRSAQLLYHLHHFAPTHPEVVLRLWAEAVDGGILQWRHLIGTLRALPPKSLRPYPKAQEALRRWRVRHPLGR